MSLDGIMFEGVTVRVRRPADYNAAAAGEPPAGRPGAGRGWDWAAAALRTLPGLLLLCVALLPANRARLLSASELLLLPGAGWPPCACCSNSPAGQRRALALPLTLGLLPLLQPRWAPACPTPTSTWPPLGWTGPSRRRPPSRGWWVLGGESAEAGWVGGWLGVWVQQVPACVEVLGGRGPAPAAPSTSRPPRCSRPLPPQPSPASLLPSSLPPSVGL